MPSASAASGASTARPRGRPVRLRHQVGVALLSLIALYSSLATPSNPKLLDGIVLAVATATAAAAPTSSSRPTSSSNLRCPRWRRGSARRCRHVGRHERRGPGGEAEHSCPRSRRPRKRGPAARPRSAACCLLLLGQHEVPPAQRVGRGGRLGVHEHRQHGNSRYPRTCARHSQVALRPLAAICRQLGPRPGLQDVEQPETHRLLDLGVTVQSAYVGAFPELIQVGSLLARAGRPSRQRRARRQSIWSTRRVWTADSTSRSRWRSPRSLLAVATSVATGRGDRDRTVSVRTSPAW